MIFVCGKNSQAAHVVSYCFHNKCEYEEQLVLALFTLLQKKANPGDSGI